MSRPIVLPDRPSSFPPAANAPTWQLWDEMQDYARAAVEADRKGIVVTDRDVERAAKAFFSCCVATEESDWIREALESFAKRLRGETP